jgi:hypothetical protein
MGGEGNEKVFMAGLPQEPMDNGEGFSTFAIFQLG